jgi:hypothetical protein
VTIGLTAVYIRRPACHITHTAAEADSICQNIGAAEAGDSNSPPAGIESGIKQERAKPQPGAAAQ